MTYNPIPGPIGKLFPHPVRSTTNHYVLGALSQGLGAFSAKLSSGPAKEDVERLLAAINGAHPYAEALVELGVGLQTLVDKLDQASADEASVATTGVLDSIRGKANFLDPFAIYAEISARLARDPEHPERQVKRIFELLRHPLSGGRATNNLLSLLEHVPNVGTQFGGDPWKAVEWAEAQQKGGQLKGLDLDAQILTQKSGS
jgi:hypothetical protein